MWCKISIDLWRSVLLVYIASVSVSYGLPLAQLYRHSKRSGVAEMVFAHYFNSASQHQEQNDQGTLSEELFLRSMTHPFLQHSDMLEQNSKDIVQHLYHLQLQQLQEDLKHEMPYFEHSVEKRVQELYSR